MTRSVKEWIGKSSDTPIPPRVRLRVFQTHNGICHISGRKIRPGEPWDAEHIIALINGGENRESNLAPALRDKHRSKTVEDVAIKAKTARVKMALYGIKRRKNKPMPGSKTSAWKRKINGEIVRR